MIPKYIDIQKFFYDEHRGRWYSLVECIEIEKEILLNSGKSFGALTAMTMWLVMEGSIPISNSGKTVPWYGTIAGSIPASGTTPNSSSGKTSLS